MLSEAQRRVLESVVETGHTWCGGRQAASIDALRRRGFVTYERRWRFGRWQYFVSITPAGRAALDTRG